MAREQDMKQTRKKLRIPVNVISHSG